MNPIDHVGKTQTRWPGRLRQILRDRFEIRLAAASCVLIVSAWIVLGLALDRHARQVAAAASEQAHATARILDERVRRSLSVADQLLKVLGRELKEDRRWSDRRVATRILRRLDPVLDEVRSITLINAQGISVGSSNPTISAGVSYVDADFFRAQSAAPNLGLHVEKPRLGPSAGQREFTVSRRISGADGEFLGVLVAVVSTDALAADFAGLTVGKSVDLRLVHIPSRLIVIRQPDYQGVFGKTMEFHNLADGPAALGQGLGELAPEAEEGLFAYRRIGDLPLAVSVGLSITAIDRHRRSEFAARLALSLLIAGAAVGVGAARRRALALRTSLRHWELIFEHAGWGVAVGSGKDQTLLQMNPAYARMHGYSLDQLRGQSIEIVFPAESRSELAAALAASRRTGHHRYEALHRHRDGRVFPVAIEMSTVVDGGRDETVYHVVNVHDVSEMRAAQEETRIAKEFFHETFDATPVGMIVVDINGRHVRVNRAMCEFTGYSESELLGMCYGDITHPDDEMHSEWAVHTPGNSRYQSFQTEKRYVHKNGSEIWALLTMLRACDGEGKLVYWAGQVLDIDRLKRAELALRVSEERFRGVFENANTGMVVADKSGRIAHFNEAFLLMLGYDAEVLEQMCFDDVAAPGEGVGEASFFADLLKTPHDKYRIERRWLACDERILWVDLHISTIRDESGAVINFIAVVSDITDRKKSNMALADSRRKLRALAAHQEGMLEQERKHIAGEVHDEMGQLLTALKMDISLMRLRFGENLQLLGMIDEMRSLVDRTINVVRQVASNLRPAVLDHGLAPAIEWLAADFSKRGTIRCRLEAGSGGFELSELQSTAVFRVVQESLTNVTRHSQAREVVISMQPIGKQLQVVVKDDGRGFDTVAVGKARGFGLFGMRERVLALGGTLRITSAPGKGTAVTIKLPLMNSEHP